MNTLTKLHKEQVDIYKGVLIEKLGVPELADAVIGTITTCKLQEIDAIIEFVKGKLTNTYDEFKVVSFLEEYKQSLVN